MSKEHLKDESKTFLGELIEIDKYLSDKIESQNKRISKLENEVKKLKQKDTVFE